MATPESRGYSALFTVDAPPHFFTMADVGEEFVRTKPFRGYDWSYTPDGTSELEIRESAMKLVACHHNYLKFWERDLLVRVHRWNYIELEGSWNDGNWISVQKCIQQFAATPPKPEYHRWV